MGKVLSRFDEEWMKRLKQEYKHSIKNCESMKTMV